MDYWLWIALAGLGLVAILFFNRQIKAAFMFARNALLGVAGMLAFNMLLAPAGLMVGVNLMTVFIVGVLGIPGFLLLYISQWMLN